MIRIGGATGYWGEADLALPQFLTEGDLDFIVFDYLAEVTMSIMARAKAADPEKGYATDFVSAIVAPHLQAIADSGVKLISNAGGVNPEASRPCYWTIDRGCRAFTEGVSDYRRRPHA